MSITIIVAVGREGAIGRRGDLAFHISADLKRFKSLTTGHTVIMGRRTFESLPKGALPNRRNIVLTSDSSYTAPGIEVFTSLPAAMEAVVPGEEAFIIGGATVYKQALPIADTIELTAINADTPDADTWFPAIDQAEWAVEADSGPLSDDRSGVSFSFKTLKKR